VNAPFLRPLACPPGIDPDEWRDVIAARIGQLHDAMQALIAALDAMDGDPDLEPSLGVRGDDRERDLDSDEGDDNSDDEHSLGWGFGENFRQGFGSLADCTDFEADEDREPSMGWSNPMAENLAQDRRGGQLQALSLGDHED